MKLFLVRHGIAVDHIGGAITRDSERTLTEEGIAEMKLVAKALTKINKKPDLILSSPLVRAKQTAEIIAAAFNMEVTLTDSLAPAGSQSMIFKAINRHAADANQVYLVGHEPDMGMLANKLLWAGIECEMPFKKAAVMRVDVHDMPPTHPGQLKWYMPPKLVHAFLD